MARKIDDDVRKLLERAQAIALDSSKPVQDALRICVAVSGKTGMAELGEWAKQELNGYGDGPVPEYRIVGAVMKMDYMTVGVPKTGQVVELGMLDEEEWGSARTAKFGHKIAEIEAMSRGDDTLNVVQPGMEYIADMIQRRTSSRGKVSSHVVYSTLSRASLIGILDAVRTRIVELVSEFEVAIRDEADPREAVAQALHVTAGDGASISVTNAGRDSTSSPASTAPAQPKPKVWERGWWTAGKIAYSSAMLAITAAAAWFAYLALPVQLAG